MSELPDEEELIAQNARAANLPVTVFLRNIRQGYEARSILDARRHARSRDSDGAEVKTLAAKVFGA